MKTKSGLPFAFFSSSPLVNSGERTTHGSRESRTDRLLELTVAAVSRKRTDAEGAGVLGSSPGGLLGWCGLPAPREWGRANRRRSGRRSTRRIFSLASCRATRNVSTLRSRRN